MSVFLRLFLTWVAMDAALLVIWIGLGGLTGRDPSESGRGLPTKIASTIFVLAAVVSGLSLFSSGVRQVVVEPIAESALGILEPGEGGSSQPVKAELSPEATDPRPSEGAPGASGGLPPVLRPPVFQSPIVPRSGATPLTSGSPTPSPSPPNCPSVTPSPSETPTPPPDSPPPTADPACPTPSPSPTTSPSESPSEPAPDPLP